MKLLQKLLLSFVGIIVGVFLVGVANARINNSTGGSASLSGGSTNALTYWTGGTTVGATTSPTVGYITATSTNTSSFGGTIRSTLVAPATFFSALSSGINTFKFFELDAGTFNTIAFDFNTSVAATMQWLDFGGCQSTWQGVSNILSFTELVCDTQINTNGSYRGLSLSAARNITLNGSGTSTPIIFQSGSNTKAVMDYSGKWGIGTTTSLTSSLTVATTTANATSTITLGKPGQNKGSCLELFDSAGTAVYAYVPAGGSAFTLSAISCK